MSMDDESQEFGRSVSPMQSKSKQSEELPPTKNSNYNNGGKVGALQSAVTKFQQFVASPKVLVISGFFLSLGLIAEGLLCFSFCEPNVRSYILSLYYIVFGLLSICMEFHFKFVGTYCQILLSYSGKGMWYLFLATLSFGS